jgi:polyisoprenoid-binding protein YceI
MSRALKVALAAAAVVVALPAGAWVYFNVVTDPAPARLGLTDDTTTTVGGGGGASTVPATASGEIGGTWKPTSASQVGYRVKEVAFGQSKEAVGRTNKVTGTMTIDGTTVTAVNLVVDMTAVSSDESRRDGQFSGRIMSVSQFPTSTFKLTSPITLSATTGTVSAKATGDLTLRGTTKPVTFDVKAQRSGSTITVNGSIPIVFADWNIPNPSNVAVKTEDHGELELLVVFAR